MISSHHSCETAVAATDTSAHQRSAITTGALLLADECDLIRRPDVDFNTTTTVTEKSLLVTASQVFVQCAAHLWGCQAPPVAWKRFCQVTMGVASGMTLNFLHRCARGGVGDPGERDADNTREQTAQREKEVLRGGPMPPAPVMVISRPARRSVLSALKQRS